MESLAEYVLGMMYPAVVEPKVEVEVVKAAPAHEFEIDLLRAEEVAELVDVHPATVYRWVRQGLLRAMRIGRVVRIRRCDVSEFVRSNLSSRL